ncbi:hypothetical protein [Pseudomonas phage COT4]|uniref:Uncharacterized protein n=1 Tax=Pseudomonas phage M5.1 TaxID=2873460 RepID=A0AAE9BP90_9CAUD|nr:hypothetical protein QGX13_gp172 [Pseudomonas phage M5.1]UAV89652.1 hypothetical protein M51_58 [Pseudomonas phage M5.1]UAV89920.1 hypothetical protein REC_57 [Pseudomonas phage REC]UGL61251.1 hypothetical protein [Pseudomonas phage COT4]UGL62647.1 hypothetical protein [Pseudomonas phage REC1]
MAQRPYDATKEHAPFDRSPKNKGRHPNKNRDTKHPVTKKAAE